MLKVNEYFNGTVKSIALANAEGTATVGVMEAGEYEFGTSTKEYMTVISGSITTLLPGEKEWKTFKKGETFIVEKNEKFKVKMTEQTAYYCKYE
ncbi:MAG: pyrimidine/purine nucleoside phosphorylase [Bacteroidales bacterium]|nr:pyrimidine/purine nucleoside phosphorylase [Bacteroidales bacterium]